MKNDITPLFLSSIWIVAVFIFFFIGFSFFPHSLTASADFFSSISNWDGKHFSSIAQNGYIQKFQYAFFPLYPLTIFLLNFIFHSSTVSAAVINLFCCFIGFKILYKLVSEEFGVDTAKKTLINILVFPTSFFFLVVYSESLFFLLTMASFYFLKRKSKGWAATLASLSFLTRISGLAVMATVLFSFLAGKEKKLYLYLLLGAGVISYMIYLFLNTGNPFYFIVAEQHWQRSITVPGAGIWETLNHVVQFKLNEEAVIEVLSVPFAVFGLGLVLRTLRFLPEKYRIYSLISLLIPLLTPTLMSFPRFLLPVFPLFIVLALIKNPAILVLYRIVSVILLAVFSVLFINGYWVS